jgi:hypothetical protein
MNPQSHSHRTETVLNNDSLNLSLDNYWMKAVLVNGLASTVHFGSEKGNWGSM